MKRQIRRGVFESNSSSSHSVCIMKRSKYYTPEEYLDGMCLWDNRDTGEKECVFHPYDHDMEFGRSPFRTLGTFKDKWLYALAAMCKEYGDDVYKELERIAFKYVPGLKKIELPTYEGIIPIKGEKDECPSAMSEDELIEFLTEKEKLWNIEINYYERRGLWVYDKPYTGYVDEDILTGFLQKENISLEEFLTNRKYIVICDGDEYCYWQDIKKCGLINMDAIDHEYHSVSYWEE